MSMIYGLRFVVYHPAITHPRLCGCVFQQTVIGRMMLNVMENTLMIHECIITALLIQKPLDTLNQSKYAFSNSELRKSPSDKE